ncbi:RNA polymerase sigma factor [Clostridium sp. D2Q-11]|uniref:RNA polymerase sigma factor n=1 Tax=Anaeromonas frigoriresistens TaxID=2683708 RepID=A0A942UX30_9FIRM|nr:RNA polymerase sigma factor [Anaeromonas frigoriresistens]MBS4538511.1 RNA polymerase sigma factor [Anaeromonas frigoriresistens]
MDNTTLIKSCQQGNLESFEELYKDYSKNALGTAYLIAGHKGIAEDIVQEAFFQCYRKIKNLRDTNAFDVWFYKLLVRIAWKMSSKYKHTVPIEEISYKNTWWKESLDAELESRETRIVIHEAIEKLSPPLKSVIILYYFNDMTIKQISRILSCVQGTVKSRLHNAKKILEKELGKDIDKNIYKTIYKGKECSIDD